MNDRAPISVNRENPHYFTYRGQPLFLLSCGDIYYDVFSPHQDFRAYLDTLAAWDSNFTRIYPAACTAFVPSDGRGSLLPWVRTDGGLYDLDRWEPSYFERLHAFMGHAEDRGIIVDVCLFNGFTTAWQQINNWCWPLLPFNAVNNVAHEGCTDMNQFTTLANPDNVRRQKEYVRKICTELRPYDNVLYDTSDEPDCFGNIPAALANPWVEEMLKEILAADEGRHLVAQTHIPPLEAGGGKDWCRDPRLAWTNAEYLRGLKDVETQYAVGKPYVQIETLSPGESPAWNRWWSTMGLVYGGDVISSSRIHAWSFMLSGGGGFLEWSAHFHPDAPFDTEPQLTILRQKRVLADFLRGFDFVRMTRFTAFHGVATEPSTEPRAWAAGLAEEGRQYAFYLSHSFAKMPVPDWYNGHFVGDTGRHVDTLTLEAPAGTYDVLWIDPADDRVLASSRVSHRGGRMACSTPAYATDIALAIRRA